MQNGINQWRRARRRLSEDEVGATYVNNYIDEDDGSAVGVAPVEYDVLLPNAFAVLDYEQDDEGDDVT